MYRHALPEGECLHCVIFPSLPNPISIGFVLPSQAKKSDDEGEKISIEDLIENQRAALGPNTTRLTFESFMEWKKKKVALTTIPLACQTH